MQINTPLHLKQLSRSESLNVAPDLQTVPVEGSESNALEGHNVFLFDGIANEVIPRQLFLDNRLTPSERNGWVVLRMLMGIGGRATPTYDDLQPYLAKIPCGQGNASRETIARILANLRLTGWLTLLKRQRDPKTGRILGNVYIVHDRPISIARKTGIDKSYIAFVAQMLRHPSKATRILANKAREEIEDADPVLATDLHEIEARISSVNRDNPLAMEQHRPPKKRHTIKHTSADTNPGISKIEPGNNTDISNFELLSSKIEPGQNKIELGQKALNQKIEPGEKRQEYDIAAKTNPSPPVQYSTCTYLYNSTSTVPSTERTVEDAISWLEAIPLNDKEKHNVMAALLTLPVNHRRPVIKEAIIRIKKGGIRNPAGYVMGIIQRARRGQFKPWAAIELAGESVDPSTDHVKCRESQPPPLKSQVPDSVKPPLSTEEQKTKAMKHIKDMKRIVGLFAHEPRSEVESS